MQALIATATGITQLCSGTIRMVLASSMPMKATRAYNMTAFSARAAMKAPKGAPNITTGIAVFQAETAQPDNSPVRLMMTTPMMEFNAMMITVVGVAFFSVEPRMRVSKIKAMISAPHPILMARNPPIRPEQKRSGLPAFSSTQSFRSTPEWCCNKSAAPNAAPVMENNHFR